MATGETKAGHDREAVLGDSGETKDLHEGDGTLPGLDGQLDAESVSPRLLAQAKSKKRGTDFRHPIDFIN